MTDFVHFFLQPIPAWTWWTFAGFMLLIELTADGGYYLLWTTVSAAITGIIQHAFPELPLIWSGLIFSCLCMVTLGGWLAYNRLNPPASSDQPFLNQRGMEHIGRLVEVKKDFVGGEGRILLNDTTWKARSSDLLKKGDQARIESLEGKVYILTKV